MRRYRPFERGGFDEDEFMRQVRLHEAAYNGMWGHVFHCLRESPSLANCVNPLGHSGWTVVHQMVIHQLAYYDAPMEVLVQAKDLGVDFYAQTADHKLPWDVAEDHGKPAGKERLCTVAGRGGTMDIPARFIDPILGEAFRDPVATVAGTVYERAPIEEWLSAHDTDPITTLPIADRTLTPQPALVVEIQSFREAHPQLFAE